MSFNNPTPLQLGQTGIYHDLNWRVIGRVVLGVVENGEIYYWNEFNLESDTGESATLVFERNERGPEWRWFTQFQPEVPLTATDAAAVRVGECLNLEDTDMRVTLVEASRIYFIEGQAPEGEHVGCEATYFNAERGDQMVVVSWTGDEVEYYRGRTIPSRTVRDAFNLPNGLSGVPDGSLSRFSANNDSGNSWVPVIRNAVMVAIIFFLVVWIFKGISSRPNNGITRISASPSPLSLGASGQLASVEYHITGHALLDLAEVNLRLAYHEYYLRDPQGHEAVLLAGLHPHDPDWVLFTPLHPFNSLTPYQAGAVRLGQMVNVAGMVVPVDELFTTTVQYAEFTGPPEATSGDTYYGFAASQNGELLLASWNESGITFWKGQKFLPRTVLTAFAPPSGH